MTTLKCCVTNKTINAEDAVWMRVGGPGYAVDLPCCSDVLQQETVVVFHPGTKQTTTVGDGVRTINVFVRETPLVTATSSAYAFIEMLTSMHQSTPVVAAVMGQIGFDKWATTTRIVEIENAPKSVLAELGAKLRAEGRAEMKAELLGNTNHQQTDVDVGIIGAAIVDADHEASEL